MRKIKTLNKTEDGSVYTLWDTENGEFAQLYTYGMMDLLTADLGDDAQKYQHIIDEVAATYTPPPPPPPEVLTPSQLQTLVIQHTQNRLDEFARTRNYYNILSACTYATSTFPKFAAEGEYATRARDATWGKLYEILDEVLDGRRMPPERFEDIESELPVLEWPN